MSSLQSRSAAPLLPAYSTVRSADGTTIGYHSLGTGPAVVVVGGALRSAVDYLPLAQVLAAGLRVHVIDRRGRGRSGPLGPTYSLDREREDLLAVQADTGARAVFGHSYGGLIVLHTAAASEVFDRVAVYEPGVSINGSIPTGWMEPYAQLLDRGDTYGAFAEFVRQSGHAPGPVARLPRWYLRAVMRLVVRGEQWTRLESLLAANLAEHRQVSVYKGWRSYAEIQAEVLLLGGRRSPAFATRHLLGTLQEVIPASRLALLDRLDHNAPDEKAPATVAEKILPFFLPSM